MKAKIIGAGSIGTHLARACVRAGWTVVVVDRDPEALRRMREEVYPARYGTWHEGISLYRDDNQPRGKFDVIFVGTPPDVRMPVALEALAERPRILQLEKPLCVPSQEGLPAFLDAYSRQRNTVALVGYDHSVAASIELVAGLLAEQTVGEIEALDVEFREHWQGIFAAHPWLRGPQDSYLGFWQRGGGAACEHSHALHLWQYLARTAGFGRWVRMAVFMDMRRDYGADYDAVAAFMFATDSGRVGRVIQDVVTTPSRKRAVLQGTAGFIEWICNGHTTGDVVRHSVQGGEVVEQVVPKTREDDFLREIIHIQAVFDGRLTAASSPLSLESGVAVMRILAAAHSNRGSVAEVGA